MQNSTRISAEQFARRKSSASPTPPTENETKTKTPPSGSQKAEEEGTHTIQIQPASSNASASIHIHIQASCMSPSIPELHFKVCNAMWQWHLNDNNYADKMRWRRQEEGGRRDIERARWWHPYPSKCWYKSLANGNGECRGPKEPLHAFEVGSPWVLPGLFLEAPLEDPLTEARRDWFIYLRRARRTYGWFLVFGFGFASWLRFKSVIIELNYARAGTRNEQRIHPSGYIQRSADPQIHRSRERSIPTHWPHPHPQSKARDGNHWHGGWGWGGVRGGGAGHMPKSAGNNSHNIGCEVFIEFAAKTPTCHSP